MPNVGDESDVVIKIDEPLEETQGNHSERVHVERRLGKSQREYRGLGTIKCTARHKGLHCRLWMA